MGSGYTRFKQCIIRSHENNVKLFIIIEGNLLDVFKGTTYSTLEGSSVVYKLFTLWVKYGVQVVFVQNRREMSEYITQFFIAVGKKHIEKNVATTT